MLVGQLDIAVRNWRKIKNSRIARRTLGTFNRQGRSPCGHWCQPICGEGGDDRVVKVVDIFDTFCL
jgi:hypothetical protein